MQVFGRLFHQSSKKKKDIRAVSFFDVLERKDNLRLDDFRFSIEFFDGRYTIELKTTYELPQPSGWG
jgi:hypothetical protein